MSSTNIAPQLHGRNITAVLIYLDRRRSRTLVGRLERHKLTGDYRFSYDEKYRQQRNALSLGPELPLTRQNYKSKELFPAFLDRLPAKENPAYIEYLQKFELSPNETDPMVLLPTIGRAGPSSFIFEPEFDDKQNPSDLKSFRVELGLSMREFAALFDISFATVNKIESGKIDKRDSLKRFDLYRRFPKAALFEAQRNLYKVHHSIGEHVLEVLKKRARSEKQ